MHPGALSASARVASAGNSFDGLNTLTITDAGGSSQVLYFGEPKGWAGAREEFSLPPTPPAGAFDARFASDRVAAIVDHQGKQEVPIRISGASGPVRITWGIKGSSSVASLRIGAQNYALTHDGSAVLSSPAQQAVLVLSETPAVPTTLALEQNYPNPFNPTTKIPYSLPAATHVRLTVINTLGEVVATLVDEEKETGYYQAVWDASNVSSGIYFYRLQAGSFTDLKKLVLMK
jgi:hypothetical protein